MEVIPAIVPSQKIGYFSILALLFVFGAITDSDRNVKIITKDSHEARPEMPQITRS
jgi:hypothetical protein